MTVRGHQVGIDWTQQGVYSNALEDVSSYILDGDITVSWGRNVDGELTLASTAGSSSFELNNESQVFSPENGSSPITGKILPGRPVRYQVTYNSATTTLLDGVLDDFAVEGDPNSVFTASVLDGWGRPGARTVSGSLHQGLRTGTAIGFVLDHIGWTGGRSIDAGATIMPWWWEEGTDANTAITKLVHSEGPPAIAYVRGGTFVFEDRHHRLLTTRSQTSQGLYTHIVPAGSGPAGDFKIEAGTFAYDHGLKNIVNRAKFAVDVRTPQDLAEVWMSEDLLTMTAGESLQFIAQASDPFLGAITPTVGNVGEGTDIQVQSGASSDVSVTMSRTSGQTTTLTITAASDVVIARIALRANPVTVSRTVQVDVSDTSSIGIFGKKEWPEAAFPVWANEYDAEAIATKIVATYANYRPLITLTIVGLDNTYLTAMMDAQVSDRITVRNDKRGINGDFIIERIEHRITNLGILHRLTISCQAIEPVQASNPLTFDVAGKGFNDGAFSIDGIDRADKVFRFDTAGHGFNDGAFAN